MKTARIILSAAAALTLAGGLASCNSDGSKPAKAEATTNKTVTVVGASNTKCPYTGQPINASVTRPYKGQNVGFCCNGCAGKWDAATDGDRDAKLAATKK